MISSDPITRHIFVVQAKASNETREIFKGFAAPHPQKPWFSNLDKQ